MPRSKRIVVQGLPHHITQRGNGRANVFDCDQDRMVFLDLLANYFRQYGLSLWGLRIPAKANTDSGGTRTAFRAEGEQFSKGVKRDNTHSNTISEILAIPFHSPVDVSNRTNGKAPSRGPADGEFATAADHDERLAGRGLRVR